MGTLRQENKEIYWAWKSMKQRCQNPKCAAYKNYGGRGISVCEYWQKFEPFLEWALASGWAKGLDLDRADNGGGYSPDNCRWVTRRENVNNRRVTLRISVGGKALTCGEWEKECKIPRGTLKIWAETKGENYAESRIRDALEHGYREKDYGNQRKKVIHIDSMTMFPSVRDAAKYFHMNNGRLSHCINHLCGRTKVGIFVFAQE